MRFVLALPLISLIASSASADVIGDINVLRVCVRVDQSLLAASQYYSNESIGGGARLKALSELAITYAEDYQIILIAGGRNALIALGVGEVKNSIDLLILDNLNLDSANCRIGTGYDCIEYSNKLMNAYLRLNGACLADYKGLN